MQTIRYGLIGLGMFLAGRGTIPKESVLSTTDLIMTAIGAVTAAVAAVHGYYVQWNTKAVPVQVAARPEIPTVSPVTGKVE